MANFTHIDILLTAEVFSKTFKMLTQKLFVCNSLVETDISLANEFPCGDFIQANSWNSDLFSGDFCLIHYGSDSMYKTHVQRALML